MRRDVEANIQVIEAVMVAILILTSMVFFTLTTRPQPEPSGGGHDLRGLAQDGLEFFRTSTVEDPDDVDADLTMEQWVSEIVNGTARGLRVASAVGNETDLFLPLGVKGVLVLSTGHGRIVLAPDLGGEPLAAAEAVGHTFVVPNWTANGDSAATTAAPGDALDWSTFTCLLAPTGHATAPQGKTWLETWQDAGTGTSVVPKVALFGVWEGHVVGGGDPDDCSDGAPTQFQVVRADGTAAPLGAYGIELVVRAGA